MDDVQCYSCGRKYEPTESETHAHTHHIGPVLDVVSKGMLAHWVEQCQRERDEAIRRLDDHLQWDEIERDELDFP